MSTRVKLVLCNEPQNCETVKELLVELGEVNKMVKGLPLTTRTYMLHKHFKTPTYLTQFTKES